MEEKKNSKKKCNENEYHVFSVKHKLIKVQIDIASPRYLLFYFTDETARA